MLNARSDAAAADERGYVVIWFVTSLMFLTLISAFTVDVGTWYATQARAQKAADAAALAAVVFLPDRQAACSAAQNQAAQNGFTINVSACGAAGSPVQFVGSDQVKVTVTATDASVFAQAAGLSSKTTTRAASAQYNAPLAIGSPSNVLGNEPIRTWNGTDANSPSTDAVLQYDPTSGRNVGNRVPTNQSAAENDQEWRPSFDTNTGFWLSVNGGATPDAQGDPNRDYSFTASVTGATGSDTLRLQIYSPQFFQTGANCDAWYDRYGSQPYKLMTGVPAPSPYYQWGWVFPTWPWGYTDVRGVNFPFTGNWAWVATGVAIGNDYGRWLAGPNKFCTGDSSAANYNAPDSNGNLCGYSAGGGVTGGSTGGGGGGGGGNPLQTAAPVAPGAATANPAPAPTPTRPKAKLVSNPYQSTGCQYPDINVEVRQVTPGADPTTYPLVANTSCTSSSGPTGAQRTYDAQDDVAANGAYASGPQQQWVTTLSGGYPNSNTMGTGWIDLGRAVSSYQNVNRTWVNLCAIPNVKNGDSYVIRVRSNLRDAGGNLYGYGRKGFALRARLAGVSVDDPARYVQLTANEKLSVYANVANSTYYITRITNDRAGKQLTLTIFDPGDGATSDGTITIYPPVNATDPSGGFTPRTTADLSGKITTDGRFATCDYSVSIPAGRPNAGNAQAKTAAPNCAIPIPKNNAYDGGTVTVSIPIPSNYSCDASVRTNCWIRANFSFPNAPTDAMVWGARIDGDPLRLVN